MTAPADRPVLASSEPDVSVRDAARAGLLLAVAVVVCLAVWVLLGLAGWAVWAVIA